MSFNYTEDTSPTLADWESILNAFNCNITEDEVGKLHVNTMMCLISAISIKNLYLRRLNSCFGVWLS